MMPIRMTKALKMSDVMPKVRRADRMALSDLRYRGAKEVQRTLALSLVIVMLLLLVMLASFLKIVPDRYDTEKRLLRKIGRQYDDEIDTSSP
jgi:hypothetical protein